MWRTIIKNDNSVYINGIPKTVDCSNLPSDFHALQWNTITNSGWVELKNDDGIVINQSIDDIAPYQWYFDQWEKPIPPPPPEPRTAQQNVDYAKSLLAETDWVNQPDVYDTSINPHLTNRDAFINYRYIIRGYIITPQPGDLNWPDKPVAIWS